MSIEDRIVDALRYFLPRPVIWADFMVQLVSEGQGLKITVMFEKEPWLSIEVKSPDILNCHGSWMARIVTTIKAWADFK